MARNLCRTFFLLSLLLTAELSGRQFVRKQREREEGEKNTVRLDNSREVSGLLIIYVCGENTELLLFAECIHGLDLIGCAEMKLKSFDQVVERNVSCLILYKFHGDTCKQ